jgi:tetratricopeptide (TPR) repeat protein
MANSTIISRKDMREPDRFQLVATQAATWLAARKKQAAVVGGAAVAVILAVGVVATIQASRAEASGRATAELLGVVAAPVLAKPEAGSTQKSFPTDEAKQRAIVTQADGLLASYGSSRPAQLALLVKGDALYALKEWDKAGAEYERYLKAAPRDDSLRFGALDGLGLVAEGKGDLAGAAKAYQRMGQEAPKYADRADLERARVLAMAGKLDEARQLLGKFGESHKDSSLVAQAAQQLAQLGAK